MKQVSCEQYYKSISWIPHLFLSRRSGEETSGVGGRREEECVAGVMKINKFISSWIVFYFTNLKLCPILPIYENNKYIVLCILLLEIHLANLTY